MTCYLDQYVSGWRYRVMRGSTLVAGSIIFSEMTDCCNALHKRFPGMVIDHVVSCE